MPEALKTTLRCDHLLEGLTGPRNVVILTVMVYYSKRIQIKVSKGNRCIGWSLGTLEQLQASSFLPLESQTDMNLLSNDMWETTQAKCCQQEKLTDVLVSRFFGEREVWGGLSHRQAEHVWLTLATWSLAPLPPPTGGQSERMSPKVQAYKNRNSP